MAQSDPSAIRSPHALGSRILIAYVLLSLASAFWAGNSVIARVLRDDVSPITLAFWRWFLAAAVVLPFVWGELRDQWPAIRRAAKTLLLCGLFGTAWQSALTFWSLHHTIALHAQLFNSTIPLTVMLAVWLLDGIRPSAREFSGFAVSLLGVFVIISHGELARLVRLDLNIGDVAALAAMLIWGIYAALVKRCPRELSPYALACVTGMIGAALIAPAHLIEVMRDPGVLAVSTPVLGAILYLGLLSSLLSTVFLNVGVMRVGPSRASIFIHLVPVFGAVMSVGILGEPFGWHHAAGFALVLGGVIICNRKPARS